jgi:hypothetical protein
MSKNSFKFILPIIDIINVIKGYCGLKGFNFEEKEIEKGRRLEISDLREKIPISIYQTGTVLIQGRECELKTTLSEFLADAESNPEKYLKQQVISAEAYKTRTTVYRIASKKLQEDIQEEIKKKGLKIDDLRPSERTGILYRYKITKFQFQVVITQFNNGTLVVQGKSDNLWDEVCTLIEQKAEFSAAEVAVRFISKSQKEAEQIIRLFTDELISLSQDQLKSQLSNECIEFIEEWDKKYLISALCLLNIQLILPEYSILVMPVAKAYEGFLKKLLISIHLCNKSETEKLGWNFGQVWRNEKYNSYIKANKLRKTMLVKLENTLAEYRHFSMHSSNAILTQVTNNQEAREKINDILETIEQAYQFFLVRGGKS